ncbi:Serine recombinase PinR [Peribacillus frigoritolerans]|nr:Serine recombinase PinR [Peribacillus frigoritolerans]
MDRLARSTFDLQKIAKDLEESGIALVFIKEQIDFSTPSGKLMFTMLGAIAEFERDLIKIEPLRDVKGQRHRVSIWDEKDVKKALKLYEERESNGLSVNDIAKMTGIPRSTIYAKAKEMISNS